MRIFAKRLLPEAQPIHVGQHRYGYSSTTAIQPSTIGESSSYSTTPTRSTLAARTPFFGHHDLYGLSGGKGEKRDEESDLVFRTDASAAIANPSPLGFFSLGFLLLFFGFEVLPDLI